MITTTTRDKFGLNRVFYRTDVPAAANSIRALCKPEYPPISLDAEGVRAHLQYGYHYERSCFEPIRILPPGHKITYHGGVQISEMAPQPVIDKSDLRELLEGALNKYMPVDDLVQSPALALSGGIDSALLLSLLTSIDTWNGTAFILAPTLHGDTGTYNELAPALATASKFGIDVAIKEVTDADFIAALPEAVALAEVPFYNMHPVSKYLLAKTMKETGVTACITGDGADQLFAGSGGEDYLHIVNAIFTGLHVNLICPFLDESVVRQSMIPDPTKSALRSLAEILGVPQNVAQAAKIPRLAPPINLEQYIDMTAITKLADAVNLPLPDLTNDREIVKWVTLSILVDAFLEED